MNKNFVLQFEYFLHEMFYMRFPEVMTPPKVLQIFMA